MMIGRPNRRQNGEKPLQKRITNQRSFEIELSKDAAHHLSYFIKQELGYYNSLVEQLTPRLRAFPQDLMSIKDREKRIWEGCAEHAADAEKMLSFPADQWPEKIRFMESMVREQDGTAKITPGQANLIKIAATPARLHPLVRKAMAIEVLRYMTGQAETMHAGLKTEGLKNPVQMLNTQTLDTKRHLQIPSSLAKIKFNEETGNSTIEVPYAKEPMTVIGCDLSEIPTKMLIIRSPHPSSPGGAWRVDFRDGGSYMITMTDHNERKRR